MWRLNCAHAINSLKQSLEYFGALTDARRTQNTHTHTQSYAAFLLLRDLVFVPAAAAMETPELTESRRTIVK